MIVPNSFRLGSGGFSMFGIEGIAPATEGAEQLLLNIDGMGCEACQLHVRTVIGKLRSPCRIGCS